MIKKKKKFKILKDNNKPQKPIDFKNETKMKKKFSSYKQNYSNLK